MAKVQIKSENLTPFGGIFSIMGQFDALLAQTIDSTLVLRCTMVGYQFIEILLSLMCVYFCGGSCVEDYCDYHRFTSSIFQFSIFQFSIFRAFGS